MENDCFQNGNIKHNCNTISSNQETMWPELGKVFLNLSLLGEFMGIYP